MRNKKKAQFIELDILLALLILVAGFLAVKQLYIHSYDNDHLQTTAKDAVNTLHAQRVGSLDQVYTDSLQSSLEGTGVNIKVVTNETVAWQLTAILIAAEDPDNTQTQRDELLALAASLADESLRGISQGYHYNVTVLSNDQRYPLATTNEPVRRAAAQARTLLSGLQVDKSIYGYTASAYLSSAQTTQSSYTYLGGFVGQGNLTLILNIPMHALNITELYVEGDFRDNFTVSINGYDICADIITPENLGPSNAITSTQLLGCVDNLVNGDNIIHLNFTGNDLNQQYVGGGYLSASYTAITTYTPPASTIRQRFPGIHGVFNLYDAISIPGELQSMRARLHYDSNHTNNNNTVFFGIGNIILHEDNESTEEQDVTITNAQILAGLQAIGQDYSTFSDTTVPFRMGFKNTSLEFLSGNLIDAVLITDLSGSMGTDLGATTRIALARQVDKEFAQNILTSNENNQIGLVGYGYIIANSIPLTNDGTLLNDTIDDYRSNQGYTCTVCGIKGAIDLIQEAPETHYRSIIVMSDGDANWCYEDGSGVCDNTGDPGWDVDWRTMPDGTRSCDCYNSEEGGERAIRQAVDYARMARDEGVEVYAIAFTSSGSSGMLRIAEVMEPISPDDWEETYYAVGNSVDEIIALYNRIAQRIISLGQYNAQVVTLSTNNDSTLFPDSYIEYTYIPNSVPDYYGELLITGERNDVCDENNLFFPSVIKPLGGTIISYSGNHWTDQVTVNGEDLFLLEDYGANYQAFGDPFVITLPHGLLNPGPNQFLINTGDDPDTSTGCSEFNKLLYSATINSTFDLTAVYPEAGGCIWNVITPSGPSLINVPSDYLGTETCTYSGPGTIYNEEDAWQALAFQLFKSFDLDLDGEIEIDFVQHDLTLNLEEQADIPYLWGPALLEVTLWQ